MVSKSFKYLKISEKLDGSPMNVPMAIIEGSQPGPKLWVQAALHGDERPGVQAIRKLVKEIDLQKLKGTIVAVPIVNTTAFEANSRFSPYDYKDPDRLFQGDPKYGFHPANPKGTMSERFAYVLENELKSFSPDCVIDCHSGGFMCLATYVDYVSLGDKALDRKNMALAEASGIPLVIRFVPLTASFTLHMSELGYPNVCFEVGCHGIITDEWVDTHYQGFINIMKHLGMIAGSPASPKKERIYVKEVVRVQPKSKGFWEGKVEIGDTVSKGDILAIITDLWGKELEQVVSPCDGLVVMQRSWATIDPTRHEEKHWFSILIGKTATKGELLVAEPLQYDPTSKNYHFGLD